MKALKINEGQVKRFQMRFNMTFIYQKEKTQKPIPGHKCEKGWKKKKHSYMEDHNLSNAWHPLKNMK